MELPFVTWFNGWHARQDPRLGTGKEGFPGSQDLSKKQSFVKWVN